MFLEVSATLRSMNEEGKRRAGEAVAVAMAGRGWNAVDLAEAAGIPDAQTVRDFIAGERWPWPVNRARIEDALGFEPGQIVRIAKDSRAKIPDDPEVDEVIVAIRRTGLSRSAKAELESHYFRLVDGDQRPESGSGVT